jgi:hypothetical protein
VKLFIKREKERKKKKRRKIMAYLESQYTTWAIAIRSRISILTIYSDPPLCILIAVICQNNTLDICMARNAEASTLDAEPQTVCEDNIPLLIYWYT